MLTQQVTNTTINVILLVGIPLGVYVAWHRRRRGTPMGEILTRAGLQVGEVSYALYCLAAAVVCVGAFFLWAPSLEVITRPGTVQARFAGLGPSFDTLAAAALYGFVQTGFCEEFLFRGLIAGSLSRRLSSRNANLIQAAIFLAPHLLLLFVMPEHWPLLILIFLGALFAGWARIGSGSILGPWLLHGGVNFGVTLYVLMNS